LWKWDTQNNRNEGEHTVNPDLNGVELIMTERARQIDIKGYDAAHDGDHSEGELALAAIAYAAPDRAYIRTLNEQDRVMFEDSWPWSEDEDKRRTDSGLIASNSLSYQTIEDRIYQLAKAGAFLAAEIDRLRRLRETE
jgi:hypothetical protein